MANTTDIANRNNPTGVTKNELAVVDKDKDKDKKNKETTKLMKDLLKTNKIMSKFTKDVHDVLIEQSKGHKIDTLLENFNRTQQAQVTFAEQMLDLEEYIKKREDSGDILSKIDKKEIRAEKRKAIEEYKDDLKEISKEKRKEDLEELVKYNEKVHEDKIKSGKMHGLSVSKILQDSLMLESQGLSNKNTLNKLSYKEKAKYDYITALRDIQEKQDKLASEGKLTNEMQRELDLERNNVQEQYLKDSSKMMTEFFEGANKIFKKNESSILGAIMGPFSLILSPFESFFGSGVFEMIGGIKKWFTQKKANPNKNDVAKVGAMGVGTLYLVGFLTKHFKLQEDKEKKGKIKEMISNLLGKTGGIGGLAKGALGKTGALLKTPMASVAGIGIGGALMAKDAIQGAKMAGQDGWSESKFSSGAGALLGGVGEGMSGAFKNGGKWATLGFGIGNKIVPGVGGLIGGAIGGLLGGVSGFIGGKRISKAIDACKDFCLKIFGKISDFMKSIPNKLFDFIKSIPNKLFDFIKSIPNKLVNLVVGGLNFLTGFDKIKEVFKGDGNIFSKILKSLYIGVLNLMTIKIRALFKMGKFIKDSKVGKAIGKFFINIFGDTKIGKMFASVTGGIKNLFDGVTKALSTIGDFFGFISDSWDWKHPIQSMTTIFSGFKIDDKTGLSQFDIWKNDRDSKITEVQDAIIRPNGDIVKTNPRDTLVALKNIPSSSNALIESRNDFNKRLESESSFNDKTISEKLDKVIYYMKEFINKEPIKIQLPSATRGDLDLLMTGAIV